jgi:23S rRNA pseudouridine1911/1915/1917 synthase
MIVSPRTPQAHTAFGTMFRDRIIKKTYLALVSGTPPSSGSITYPLARDLQDKTKIKALFSSEELFYRSRTKVREAHTNFTSKDRFDSYSLVEVKPITGRTHQIRVHLVALGHPVLGDALYGTPSSLIQRQALHASEIQFQLDGKEYHFCAPIPDDFSNLIKKNSE